MPTKEQTIIANDLVALALRVHRGEGWTVGYRRLWTYVDGNEVSINLGESKVYSFKTSVRLPSSGTRKDFEFSAFTWRQRRILSKIYYEAHERKNVEASLEAGSALKEIMSSQADIIKDAAKEVQTWVGSDVQK